MNILTIILTKLSFLAGSAIIAYFSYWFYNRFPLTWFMENSENLTPIKYPNPRMKLFPDGAVYISTFIFLMFIFYLKYEFSILLLCNILMIFFLSYLFVADIKTRILPDQFIFGLFFVSLFWIINELNYIQETGETWYSLIFSHLLGAIVGGAILLLIHLLGSFLLKQEAIGMGDIKLVFAIGMCLGVFAVIWIICLSFILALFPSILSLSKNRAKGYKKNVYKTNSNTIYSNNLNSYTTKTNSPDNDSTIHAISQRLPFAPFISIGTIIYLFIPDELAMLFEWYINL